MILTGPQIRSEWDRGRIVIDPFDEAALNPNSYNFSLGDRMRVYSTFPLDPKLPSESHEIEVPEDGLRLEARRLYLGSTMEVLGSRFYAPTFAARSSVARLGLFINLSASLGDIGYIGQWTLQLYATHDLVVYPRMHIGQMMFWQPMGDIVLYDGKYQHSRGPRSTLIHRDFRESR